MVAWIMFLESDHKFLVEKRNPRTIPVFGIIVDDFLEEATRRIDFKNNIENSTKKVEPPSDVDPAQGEQWQKCLRQIESQINPENYTNLIEPLVFGGAVNGHVDVICFNKNHKSTVEQNYGELLETSLVEVFGREVKVRLIVPEANG